MKDECLGCKHNHDFDDGWYCYMFKTQPDVLPCGQHDKFEMERQIMGEFLIKNPEILAMMIAYIR